MAATKTEKKWGVRKEEKKQADLKRSRYMCVEGWVVLEKREEERRGEGKEEKKRRD